MKKNYKKIAAFLGLSLICVSMFGNVVPAYAVNQTDIDNAQNQINEREQQIANMGQELANLANNITDAKEYIKTLDGQMSTLTGQLNLCRDNIVAKQAEIDAKQVAIDAKQVEVDNKIAEISSKQLEIDNTQKVLEEEQAKQEQQYSDMAKRIQYMYECGDETFLDMIFSSEDLSEVLGRTEYISSITAYDRKQLSNIMETKNGIADLIVTLNTERVALENDRINLEAEEENLKAQKTNLETEKSQMESLKIDLESQQAYIDVVREAKNKSLGDLEDQESASEVKLEALRQELEDEKRIKADLEAKWKQEQEEAAKQNQDTGELATHTLEEIGLSGGFTWPLPGYNMITSEWSPSRLHPILGVYKMHDGMDISGGGVNGKPIVAAYEGTVILAEYYYGYGNCVQISHGPGVVTLYAHCSSLAVSAGQHVSAGQVIGYVGSTGNSTGPHLHLTLFLEGVSVNPREYFTIPR